MNILLVVDVQNDFISGALGSESAKQIVPLVAEKVRIFDGKVIFTKDTHSENYLNTMEGRNLPVKHCIKGTVGHDIPTEIGSEKYEIIEKPGFGSPKLIQRLQNLDSQEKLESITIIGICTDICVVVNALTIKSFFPETPIIVDSICCAGVTDELHQKALDVMAGCQIQVI